VGVYSNLTKHFIFFFIFLLIKVILFILTNSIVTFFHLILDHRLVDVQDWIYTNAWSLYIFVLLTSVAIMLKVISTSLRESTAWSLVRNEFIYDLRNKEAFTLSAVLIICFIILGQPILNTEQSLKVWPIIISYLGHCLMIGSTICLFFLVVKIKVVVGIQRWFSAGVFLIGLGLVDIGIIKFTQEQNSTVFVLMSLCLYFAGIAKKPSLRIALGVGFFAIAPVLVLLGQDFLWGSEHSLYSLTKSLRISEMFILCILLGLLPRMSRRFLARRY
jgi:hypothetical protein